jgi:hypothetical protein
MITLTKICQLSRDDDPNRVCRPASEPQPLYHLCKALRTVAHLQNASSVRHLRRLKKGFQAAGQRSHIISTEVLRVCFQNMSVFKCETQLWYAWLEAFTGGRNAGLVGEVL